MIGGMQGKPRSTDEADSINYLAHKTEKTNEELTWGTLSIEGCASCTAYSYRFGLSVGAIERQAQGQANRQYCAAHAI
jgi:hypothetical protein